MNGRSNRSVRGLGLLLVGLAAAGGSYLAGSFLLVGELRDEVDMATRHRLQLQQQFLEAKAAERSLHQFREAHEWVKQTLSQLPEVGAWSPDVHPDELIARTAHQIEEHQLILDDLGHESVPLPIDDRYQHLSIEIGTRGTYSDLTRFCASFDHAFRSAAVQNIELVASEGQGPSALVRARLSVSFIHEEATERDGDVLRKD